MQHRQSPLVGLAVLDGEGLSGADVDQEFREKLGALAAEYLPLLRAARSPWLSFALVIASETGGVMERLTRVV